MISNVFFNPFIYRLLSQATESRPRGGSFTVEYANLEEFVKATGGKKAIKKILIANNGLGAVKLIRSVRKFCYEMFKNEREVIKLVASYILN